MNLQALSGLEFAALYLCAGVFGLAAAKGAEYAIIARETKPADGSHAASPSRSLEIGSFPRPRDVFLIAALRGGKEAVAETILASALASRWLTSTDDGAFFVGQRSPNVADEVYDFGRRITASRISRESALRYARASAQVFEARHHEVLDRLGLRVKSSTKLLAQLTTIALGGLVVLVGVARLGGDGLDVTSRAVIGVELALFALTALLLARPTTKTPAGTAYEAWLLDNTVSLRADVAAYRTRVPEDLVLAAALVGAEGVPGLDAFYGDSEKNKPEMSGETVAG